MRNTERQNFIDDIKGAAQVFNLVKDQSCFLSSVRVLKEWIIMRNTEGQKSINDIKGAARVVNLVKDQSCF